MNTLAIEILSNGSGQLRQQRKVREGSPTVGLPHHPPPPTVAARPKWETVLDRQAQPTLGREGGIATRGHASKPHNKPMPQHTPPAQDRRRLRTFVRAMRAAAPLSRPTSNRM